MWRLRFKKFLFLPSTRTRENSVLKKFHSGERFWKVPFSVIVFIGYVHVDGSRIRKEKVAFSNENGYVGTGPKSQEVWRTRRKPIWQTKISLKDSHSLIPKLTHLALALVQTPDQNVSNPVVPSVDKEDGNLGINKRCTLRAQSTNYRSRYQRIHFAIRRWAA